MISPAPSRLWLFLLALPLIELVGHATIRSRVVADQDWQAAAALVRAQHEPGDLITVAPAWADPLLRQALGDRLAFADVGRSDLSGYRRLWAISLRGQDPPEMPVAPPESEQVVGRLRVRRWDLPKQPAVLFDFVDRIGEAEVEYDHKGRTRACPWQRFGPTRGGGLGRSPLAPAERFACDRRRPWLWVQATVLEELGLTPRHCVFQHPAGREPVRVRYADVPLGEHIVVHGGVYYEHERHEKGAPVDLVLRVDGNELGRLQHRDGRGWQRLVVAVPASHWGQRAEVSFEVTTPKAHHRSFCWSARSLGGPGVD